MSIDISEETYGRPLSGGRKPVPYLRLVHSSDFLPPEEETERERNGSFVLTVFAAALAVLTAVLLTLF